MPVRRCKAMINDVKCRIQFEPSFNQEWWCCSEHRSVIVDIALAKVRKKSERDYKAAQKVTEKAERKHWRDRKQAIKPSNEILSEAQQAFNEYIRYRDMDLVCINEGVFVVWNDNKSDAAHYVSRSANSAMRFDMRNVNKSTKKSNDNQEKWHHDYRENLKIKLGDRRFAEFEADCKHWKINKRTFNNKNDRSGK